MNQAGDKLDRLLAAAADAQRSDHFDLARQIAEQALVIDQTSVAAKFLLGLAQARLGDYASAATLFEQVLLTEPKSFEVLTSLATVYRDSGRLDDSIAVGVRAVAAMPKDAKAHNNLGLSFLAARKLAEAASAFMTAISLRPDFASPHFNLGKVRQLEGKDGEAARCFSRAASLAPTLPNLLAFGQMLLTLCDFDTAAECARRCVAMFPSSAAAHLLLCGCLTESSRFEEAERHLLRAIELDPHGEEALQTAARQRPLGYIEEANENLRRAISRNPRLVSAYDSLMQNHKVAERDRPLVEQMQSLLVEGGLSPTEFVSIHYGLGKALEDLRESEAAMLHYDEANRITRMLKFGDASFDEDRYRRRVDHVLDLVSSDPSEEEVGGSDLPILIIGMMRSGTSLVEQILSNHPDVAGAGEQLFWSRNWDRAVSGDSISVDCARRVGEEYVSHLRRFGPHARHVTDKMPGNYMFAGLISLALPNAKFVHIRRNPADTCLSIWATPNHQPHEGGNHKGNIAFVYRQYLRLMERWRAILPPDRLLEVDYELLVSEPDRIIRSIVSFCGLEWDDACLRPQDNRRLVNTPSAWQVRQPVYKSSVARWQRFEPWLGEFRDLLDVAHPPVQ